MELTGAASHRSAAHLPVQRHTTVTPAMKTDLIERCRLKTQFAKHAVAPNSDDVSMRSPVSINETGKNVHAPLLFPFAVVYAPFTVVVGVCIGDNIVGKGRKQILGGTSS